MGITTGRRYGISIKNAKERKAINIYNKKIINIK